MRAFHLIEEVVFDVTFDTTALALEQQDRIQSFLTENLLPAIDELFNRYSDVDTVLNLDSVEIDLGDVPADDFRNEITRRVTEQLGVLLQEKRQQAKRTSVAGTALISRGMANLEQLEDFLMHGTLHWHADVTNDQLHEDLLDRVLQDNAAEFAAYLKRSEQREKLIERLVRQFPDGHLERLVWQLAPSRADAALEFIGDCRRASEEQGSGHADRMQLMWQHVLEVLSNDAITAIDGDEFAAPLLQTIAQARGKRNAPMRSSTVDPTKRLRAQAGTEAAPYGDRLLAPIPVRINLGSQPLRSEDGGARRSMARASSSRPVRAPDGPQSEVDPYRDRLLVSQDSDIRGNDRRLEDERRDDASLAAQAIDGDAGDLRDRVARSILTADARHMESVWDSLLHEHAALLREELCRHAASAEVRRQLAANFPQPMLTALVHLLQPDADAYLLLLLESPLFDGPLERSRQRLWERSLAFLLSGARDVFDPCAFVAHLLADRIESHPARYRILLGEWRDELIAGGAASGMAAILDTLLKNVAVESASAMESTHATAQSGRDDKRRAQDLLTILLERLLPGTPIIGDASVAINALATEYPAQLQRFFQSVRDGEFSLAQARFSESEWRRLIAVLINGNASGTAEDRASFLHKVDTHAELTKHKGRYFQLLLEELLRGCSLNPEMIDALVQRAEVQSIALPNEPMLDANSAPASAEDRKRIAEGGSDAASPLRDTLTEMQGAIDSPSTVRKILRQDADSSALANHPEGSPAAPEAPYSEPVPVERSVELQQLCHDLRHGNVGLNDVQISVGEWQHLLAAFVSSQPSGSPKKKEALLRTIAFYVQRAADKRAYLRGMINELLHGRWADLGVAEALPSTTLDVAGVANELDIDDAHGAHDSINVSDRKHPRSLQGMCRALRNRDLSLADVQLDERDWRRLIVMFIADNPGGMTADHAGFLRSIGTYAQRAADPESYFRQVLDDLLHERAVNLETAAAQGRITNRQASPDAAAPAGDLYETPRSGQIAQTTRTHVMPDESALQRRIQHAVSEYSLVAADERVALLRTIDAYAERALDKTRYFTMVLERLLQMKTLDLDAILLPERLPLEPGTHPAHQDNNDASGADARTAPRRPAEEQPETAGIVHTPAQTDGREALGQADTASLRHRVAQAILHADAQSDWPTLMRAHRPLVRNALFHYGARAQVRQRLAADLPEPLLMELIDLLEPQAATIVGALLDHPALFDDAEEASQQQRLALWEVSLTYLLTRQDQAFDPVDCISGLLAALGTGERASNRALAQAWRAALAAGTRYPEVIAGLDALLAREPAGDASRVRESGNAAFGSEELLRAYDLYDSVRQRLLSDASGAHSAHSVHAAIDVLAGECPAHLKRLFNALRCGELPLATAPLNAHEWRRLVTAFVSIPDADGNADRTTFLQAIDTYAEHAGSEAHYFQRVLQDLLQDRVVDLEAIAATAGKSDADMHQTAPARAGSLPESDANADDAVASGDALYARLRQWLTGSVASKPDDVSEVIDALTTDHPAQLARLWQALRSGDISIDNAPLADGIGRRLITAFLASRARSGMGDAGTFLRTLDARMQHAEDRGQYWRRALMGLLNPQATASEKTVTSGTTAGGTDALATSDTPTADIAVPSTSNHIAWRLPDTGWSAAQLAQLLTGAMALDRDAGALLSGWMEKQLVDSPAVLAAQFPLLLKDGTARGKLAQLLPERLLAGILLLLRPAEHDAMQRCADTMADIFCQTDRSVSPVRVTSLKWQFIFRYLADEPRRFERQPFADGLAHDLVTQTGTREADAFHAMLAQDNGLNARTHQATPVRAGRLLESDANAGDAVASGDALYARLRQWLTGSAASKPNAVNEVNPQATASEEVVASGTTAGGTDALATSAASSTSNHIAWRLPDTNWSAAQLLTGAMALDRGAGASLSGWMEKQLADSPAVLATQLPLVLKDGTVAANLAQLLPERLLTRILLLLRPAEHDAMQRCADTVADIFCQADRSASPVRVTSLKWQFIFRNLTDEHRRFARQSFADGLAHDLVAQTGTREADAFHAMLAQDNGLNARRSTPATNTPKGDRPAPGKTPPSTVDPIPKGEAARASERRSPKTHTEPVSEPTEEIYIANAGQVLAAPYFPRLFAMLNLVEMGKFVDQHAAERAAHLLQFMVNEKAASPEYQLVLNKLLCGVKTGVPIVGGIEISAQEKEAVEALIQGMIANWTVLGNTSIKGLRESFLQRPGWLQLKDDAWHLQVQPGTFDMLLDRLPWGFSIIKHPWMERPVHINWR